MDSEEVNMAMKLAVELARENVHNGGGPFGAVVVNEDGVVATGVNRVTSTPDPTAHAEVEAIRAAAAKLNRFDLTGCVLYASCAPCPMCAAAAHWARVDRVVYAASSVDAAEAGFDDALLWDEMAGRVERSVTIVQLHIEEKTSPFDAWGEHADRTAY